MSEYIADSAALTATADSIRAKGGTSAPLEWDETQGFKAAVDSIPSGGGFDWLPLIRPNNPADLFRGGDLTGLPDGSVLNLTATSSVASAFRECTNCPPNLTVYAPKSITFGNAFYQVYGLKNAKVISSASTNVSVFTSIFAGIANDQHTLETVELIDFHFANCSWLGAFQQQTALKTIIGEIDATNITNWTNTFNNCTSLENIAFKQNTIHINPVFSTAPALSDASIISVANGLDESYTLNLSLHNTVKAKCNAIVGTVSLDPTETYHIFTEDPNGAVTLTDFITNTKGWTIL